jgi:hypothetical protein
MSELLRLKVAHLEKQGGGLYPPFLRTAFIPAMMAGAFFCVFKKFFLVILRFSLRLCGEIKFFSRL